MRWRPHHLSRIELLLAGITLSATFGYALSGSVYGVAATLIVAALLVTDGLRRGAMPGLWLVALGFFASGSRLSVTETEAALGALRIPMIVGGSLLAIAVGFVVDAEFRIGLRRAPLTSLAQRRTDVVKAKSQSDSIRTSDRARA